MKILVFGAGAIGSVLGGLLSRSEEVTLLGRPRYLQAIQKKGLRLSGIWGKHHFKKLRTITRLKDLKPSETDFDLILVTVKSYDTERAAQALKKFRSSSSIILSLQNGLGNLEILRKYFPAKNLLGGRIIFGAQVIKPGEVRVTVMAEPTAIGEVSQNKITKRVRKIAALFSKSGAPTIAVPKIERLLWRKVIYNSALNPLASLMGCHYGLLGEYELTRKIMNQVMAEIYQVARKEKVKLDPSNVQSYQKVFYQKLLPPTYRHKPSMLQDLMQSKRTEIDAMNGAIVRKAEKNKVAVPMNRLLWELIKIREKRS